MHGKLGLLFFDFPPAIPSAGALYFDSGFFSVMMPALRFKRCKEKCSDKYNLFDVEIKQG
jgi:hypothetical protein